MSDLLVLGARDVAALLPSLEDQLRLVERCYRDAASGRVQLPPKPAIHPRPGAFVHAMPAYVESVDVVALKWISGYSSNKRRGLPYLNGVILLNDPETGVVTTILDAAEITAARTAAASGVCIRAFAPERWKRAAIIGCGVQGRAHARLLRDLEPSVGITAYDVHPERIRALGHDVWPATDPRRAVAGADVVLTAAAMNGERGGLSPDHLEEGALVLAIDFDASIAATAVDAAAVFLVDDVPQFEHYRDLGYFAGWPEADASVGEALAVGLRHSGTMVCCNLGIGALDAVLAQAVVESARSAGLGSVVRL